jgi:hypothetical protein
VESRAQHLLFVRKKPAERQGKALPLGRIRLRQPPAATLCIALIASSIVKLFGFWIGGKSLNVAAN